jgi:hypothetical protein
VAQCLEQLLSRHALRLAGRAVDWMMIGTDRLMALLRPMWRVLAASTLCLILPAAAVGEELPYVQRGLFLSGSSYGSLAWIDGVNSWAQARQKQFVYNLSLSTCHNIPKRDTYWFLLNSHGLNTKTLESYFAVRAIAQSGATTSTSHGLILYRNTGWTTASGNQLTEVSGSNRLSIKDFVKFHDDAQAAGQSVDQRLQELNTSLGVTFHALPAANEPSSWEHRNIFADQNHLNDSPGDPLFYWASLTRFSTGDSTPIIFYLGDLGISTMWISVDGSDIEFPLQQTEVRIGKECDGALAPHPGKIGSRF